MSIYSAIQFTSVTFLYASGSNLGDFQFLFIDMVLILPIAIFSKFSPPASDLDFESNEIFQWDGLVQTRSFAGNDQLRILCRERFWCR